MEDRAENNKTERPAVQKGPLTVICGANKEFLEECFGITVGEIRRRMRGVLNIGDEHDIVLVDGRKVNEPDNYILEGGEELEFRRPAGRKG